MLHSLKIKNFSSVRDELELDFRVAANVPEDELQFATPLIEQPRVPRVVSIFGPNAAGKSTILKGFEFVKWFIRQSIDLEVDASIPIVPFFNKANLNHPHEFTIEFDAIDLIVKGSVLYRYVLKINPAALDNSVLFEGLYYKPEKNFRRVFERSDEGIVAAKEFELPKSDPRRGALNPRASLTSVLGKFGHEQSQKLNQLFGGMLGNMTHSNRLKLHNDHTTQFYERCSDEFEKLKGFLKHVDLGNLEVDLKEDNGNTRPFFKHAGLDLPLPLSMESEGTQHIYKFFPAISIALDFGGFAIVDELDSDVHPVVLNEIIRLFRNSETNRRNAQLIFSCHNPSILDQLSKEEVFLVEKDKSGSTQCYGLKDVAGLRRDGSLYKKYIGGHLGGLPSIG